MVVLDRPAQQVRNFFGAGRARSRLNRTYKMTTNLTVILGAGASKGSVEAGKTSKYPIIPPITKELFEVRFEEILDKYRDVRTSMGSISSEVDNGKSLEDYIKENLGILSKYESLQSHRKRQINQLPLYLQDLFSYISKQLESKNHYHRLISDLFDRDIKLTFLTLNYDLLLDNAIERVTNNKFTDFSSYVNEPTKWVLVKPHGSVNWFRQIVNFTQSGNDHNSWKAIVRNMNLLKDLGKEIVFVDLEKQFKNGFVNNIPCYPVLAIPNTEYTPIFPINEKLLLEERLQKCENFLIIGFSAYDQDILETLKKNVKNVKKLLIVGKGDSQDTYKRLVVGVPAFKRDEWALAECKYDLGFESFVRQKKGTSDLKNFLSSL